MRELAILSLAVPVCVYEVVEDSVKSYMAERDEGIRVAVTRGFTQIRTRVYMHVHACRHVAESGVHLYPLHFLF